MWGKAINSTIFLSTDGDMKFLVWVSVPGASCLLCIEVIFCRCAVLLLGYRSIREDSLSIILTTERVHVGNLPDTQEEKVGRDTVRKRVVVDTQEDPWWGLRRPPRGNIPGRRAVMSGRVATV